MPNPRLPPGLAPDAVRARLAEVGMEPAAQLLTWFAWHNGIADPNTSFVATHLVKWMPYSLDQAFEWYHMQDQGSQPWEWAPTWLPIGDFGGMPRLVVDCTPPQDRVCTVRMVSPDEGLFSATDRPPKSLDWAVRHWISKIEDYGFHVHPPTGTWDGPRNDIPLEDRLTGI